MPDTITAKIDFVLVSCAQCGIGFFVSAEYDREKRKDHTHFYCPNGHKQYYPRVRKKRTP